MPSPAIFQAGVVLLLVQLTVAMADSGPNEDSALAQNLEELPNGLQRGPLRREHSLVAPLVHDWWEEGLPHFMVGGFTVVTDKSLRLTTNQPRKNGFVFNTVPLDHSNWEARLKFSIRPPLPADVESSDGSPAPSYHGGDGIAFWYLVQPIGDDHQHVEKHTVEEDAELAEARLNKGNPWRVADELLHTDGLDVDDEEDELEDGEEVDADRLEAARTLAERKAEHRRKEEQFRRLFHRGISSIDHDDEPAVMGVKYGDFSAGFAVVVDSVGLTEEQQEEYSSASGVVQNRRQTVSLLLNSPAHVTPPMGTPKNNFDAQKPDFRTFPSLLQCHIDFVQEAHKRYIVEKDSGMRDHREAAALAAPEDPVELVVRYHERKITVLLKREVVGERKVISSANDADAVQVKKSYNTSICGELRDVLLPNDYFFGVSSSTGKDWEAIHRTDTDRLNRHGLPLHPEGHKHYYFDLHDVYGLEIREIGTHPEQFKTSNSGFVEHFNHAGDAQAQKKYTRPQTL